MLLISVGLLIVILGLGVVATPSVANPIVETPGCACAIGVIGVTGVTGTVVEETSDVKGKIQEIVAGVRKASE